MHNPKSHHRPQAQAQEKIQAPEEIKNSLYALSAEEYEKFRQRIVLQSQPVQEKPGIGLAPSDSQCRAIETMCAGLGVAILEVFAGRRPVQHLAKWLSKDCHRKVTARSQLTSQVLRRKYARQPLNHSPYSSTLRLPKPRRVRAQKISPTAFEVCLIMQDYSRVRAMALRVEKIFSTWKITEIEVA